MKAINEVILEKKERPIKAVQFGEGNFLRAFVDYMLDILNDETDFNGSTVLIKPIQFGSVEQFAKQNNLYTVYLRGLENGRETIKKRVITSISKTVAAHEDYEEYAALAKLDTLRFVISNTTEAGIVLNLEDKLEMTPPASYPAKLAKFLYERYKHFGGDKEKGLIILPVELIDNNGRELEKCVKALAEAWNLESGYINWLDEACVFASTLVDRIVTGYPRDEDRQIFEEFGYEDKLLVTGEPFALWVIESDRDISGELPFEKAGLPVIFTDNHKPYKQRKVRILNGAHTSFVLASYLAGNDYVGQSMDDETVFGFMKSTIFDEVIPTLDLPEKELNEFAEAVIDRFRNPFIKHSLLAISLNSVSKWKARCMPSFTEYVKRKGALPKHLTFSLASLIAFYCGSEIRDGALIGNRNGEEYLIKDDGFVLEFFAKNSSLPAEELTKLVLENTAFWGENLAEYLDAQEVVSAYISDIRALGMRKAMEKNFG
ncbi:MAG: tagaturonate reductase [Oscillospiraceae bacterium]|nr:tagaturonate reductase [Oscillospiraceae bacterium]